MIDDSKYLPEFIAIQIHMNKKKIQKLATGEIVTATRRRLDAPAGAPKRHSGDHVPSAEPLFDNY